MKILLTNDDGISAPGMEALLELAGELEHEIYVVAPKHNKSGVGHGITLGKEIEIVKSDLYTQHIVKESWQVAGTPVDAVKFAIGNNIVKPDLIISGINSGPNMGRNIFYSGTVGAAMEGVFHGVPSVALSVYNWENPNWKPAIHYGREIVLEMIGYINKLDDIAPFLLNVNFPDLEIDAVKGVRLTKQGRSGFKERFFPAQSGEDNLFYLDGEMTQPDTETHYDFVSVKEGYISASTLIPELNCGDLYENFKKKEFLSGIYVD